MLTAGEKIGIYEVVCSLGAGGMGEVYRARDTKLQRDVALKILPDAMARDGQRMARFEREAQVLASLNHPNIAAIYGLEESNGVRALVMELVEGQTLAERLRRTQPLTRPASRDTLSPPAERGKKSNDLTPSPSGRERSGGTGSNEGSRSSSLTIDETLPISRQIAEALEYAHERGVIHRDLKPANVKITPEGTVKVLDFGLAKVLDAQDSTATMDMANSPTLSAMATQAGMILGTAAYMSPEQAKGQRVDRRADIWAFGCVLFEMLSGQKPFEGETISDVLASVIKSEPDWAAIPDTTPRTIQKLVRRCLIKDAKQRLRDIGEARIAIEETLSGSPALTGPLLPGEGGPEERDRVRVSPMRRALPWVIAIAAVLSAAGLVMFRTPSAAPPPSYQQLTFQRGPIWAARFAPDGQSIVYAAAWDAHPIDLYTTSLGSPGGRSLSMPGTTLLAVSSTGEMAVCLNGTFQGFFYQGTLASVPLAGGGPREVLGDVGWADWSHDGSNLAVVHMVRGEDRLEYPIGKVLYETSGWISHIRISPKGDRIAFFDHPLRGDDRGSVADIDLQGKKTILSTGWESEEGLAWLPTGKEVWFTAAKAGNVRQLYAVSLDGKQRIVARVPGGMTLQDIFPDGRALLTRDNQRADIMGRGPDAKEERNLSWLDASVPWDLSADGRTLLFDESGEGGGPLYAACIRKTDGSSPPVRLGTGYPTSLSPDGKWALSIILSSPEKLVMLPTGVGSESVLPAGPIEHYSWAQWFRDGKRILVVGRAPGHAGRCYVQEASGGEPKPITPEGTKGFRVSPDGKEVLASDSQDKFWLYPVAGGKPQPVPGLEAKDVPVQWSADGRAIFVMQGGTLSAKVYRFDLATGKRQLWKELAPPDRTGLTNVFSTVVTPSGSAYAYGYVTLLSDLYLAKGLK